MDIHDEIERALCSRLDAIEARANRVAAYHWPRFKLVTLLKDYVQCDIVFEFLDLQPSYLDAAQFTARVMGEHHKDFVLFNSQCYYALLWLNLQGTTRDEMSDRMWKLPGGWCAWTEERHGGGGPPQLTEDERRLLRHGLVLDGRQHAVPKPRTFSWPHKEFFSGT